MNRIKGLTLIEILISMAVFGILIIAATNLFFSGISVWDYGENVYNKLTDIEFFYKKLENDLNRINPFIYAGAFRKDEGFLKSIFQDDMHKDKFTVSLKDQINMVDYKDFYNGSSGNAILLSEFFLYDKSLTQWYTGVDHRKNCWNFFKKEKWERWKYNIPDFDWKDIGIFTDKGFIFYGLGDNFSYKKYRGLSFFYDEDERVVYYYRLEVTDPNNIIYPEEEVLLENVLSFNIKYYSHNNDLIPIEDNFNFVIAGFIRSMEIQVELSDDELDFVKKKVFYFNLKKM